jgi:hypothetical protein
MPICGASEPHYIDANPDPTFHFDADPDPSFQIRLKTLKIAQIGYFGTFWLIICKLMRIRIHLATSMLIRIRILHLIDADERIQIRNTANMTWRSGRYRTYANKMEGRTRKC